MGQSKDQTLKERLFEHDLSGEGTSTFFRNIGAVLGYRPERGTLVGKSNQNNYAFTYEDKIKIVSWIDGNIRVCWRETKPCYLDGYEKYLIQKLYPLLKFKTQSPEIQATERNT